MANVCHIVVSFFSIKVFSLSHGISRGGAAPASTATSSSSSSSTYTKIRDSNDDSFEKYWMLERRRLRCAKVRQARPTSCRGLLLIPNRYENRFFGFFGKLMDDVCGFCFSLRSAKYATPTSTSTSTSTASSSTTTKFVAIPPPPSPSSSSSQRLSFCFIRSFK